MNQQTKSLIRHVLTGLGTLLAVFGLSKFIPLLDILSTNLDSLWSAIEIIVGVVLALIGFFKDKGERFELVSIGMQVKQNQEIMQQLKAVDKD